MRVLSDLCIFDWDDQCPKERCHIHVEPVCNFLSDQFEIRFQETPSLLRHTSSLYPLPAAFTRPAQRLKLNVPAEEWDRSQWRENFKQVVASKSMTRSTSKVHLYNGRLILFLNLRTKEVLYNQSPLPPPLVKPGWLAATLLKQN